MSTTTSTLTASLSLADAVLLTSSIREALQHTQELLRTAWRGRVWAPLGYRDCQAYIDAELGDLRMRLPVDQRRTEVAAWRAEGASVRAIAAAVGASVGTVAADVKRGDPSAASPVLSHGPQTVVSLDGRRRPATATPARSAKTGLRRTKTATVLDDLAPPAAAD